MNTMTSTPLRTLVAGAILSSLALGFATVSCADERATSPQLIVKFGDLDVSTSKAAAALYGRIHNAAFNVCWRMYDHDNLAYRLNKDACLQKVIADAVTKVNQPALSAVFASKYGLSAPLVLAAAKMSVFEATLTPPANVLAPESTSEPPPARVMLSLLTL